MKFILRKEPDINGEIIDIRGIRQLMEIVEKEGEVIIRPEYVLPIKNIYPEIIIEEL